jgi:hypothetical protein
VPHRKDFVIELTIYTRDGCHLCHDMTSIVERVVRQMQPVPRIEEIDIGGDPVLEALYGREIPVLLVNGKKAAKYRITEEELRRLLDSR